MQTPFEPLPERTAHVWLVEPERIVDGALLAEYEALLSAAERERRARFRSARLRHDFLIARALVRTTLARYTGVDPRALTFDVGAHGRPDLAAVHGSTVSFNLSHTRGLIACALVDGHAVGVDVEDRERKTKTSEVAERFFSTKEVAALRALPASQQQARFFEYWTLKEAYIKARGMGLAIPLGHFSFEVDAPGGITIAFDPALDDDPGRWQFMQRWLTPRHSIALAISRTGDDVAVDLRRGLPPAP
ncbi:MAG: 4'-phosphopantetheinyl transferase superfamily protein [Planctomycetota bacterium]